MKNNMRLIAMSIGCIWVGITGLNMAILPNRYALHAPVEVVADAPLPLVVRAPAALAPKQSITFKAEFDGPVVAKHYVEGQPVQKDQLLLEIGRDKIRLDYQSKSDALKNAKSDLVKAEKEEKLQKILYKRQAVARSSVDDAKSAHVKAAQALRSAEEAFGLEQARWDKNKLYAPFSGTVIKDAVGSDLNVATGKDLLTIADVSGFAVSARVDELDIAQIREGQDAQVRVEAFSEAWLPARISQIGTRSDVAGAPEIPVTLVLLDPQGLSLRPNLTAEVRIVTGQTGAVLSVPLTAIANQDGQTKVWVVTSSNRLESRRVTIGKSNPERAEVTQGLRAGERVCSQAEGRFSEGMKIQADPAPLHP